MKKLFLFPIIFYSFSSFIISMDDKVLRIAQVKDDLNVFSLHQTKEALNKRLTTDQTSDISLEVLKRDIVNYLTDAVELLRREKLTDKNRQEIENFFSQDPIQQFNRSQQYLIYDADKK